MRITKIRKITFFAYIIFLTFNVMYFYLFFVVKPLPLPSATKQIYYDMFIVPANFDHLKYMLFIGDLEVGKSIGRISNTKGICYFYYYLRKVVHLDYVYLSFIVNNILFLFSYVILMKILDKGYFSKKYSFLFFFNPQLIYYSQLMNKEAFTLFFVLLMTYLLITKNEKMFFFVVPAAMIIRGQLLIFAFSLYWLYHGRVYWLRIIQIYLINVCAATVLANTLPADPFILKDTFFSKFIFELNRDYYIGTLLLGPVKIIQFFYDQLLIFKGLMVHFREFRAINLYFLRDVAPVFSLFLLSNRIFRVFTNIKVYCRQSERFFLNPIIAFVFMLMIYPYCHQRYLFPVIVLTIHLGLAYTGPVKSRYSYRERCGISSGPRLGMGNV